ncbi:VWA domain-containing protein [Nannocystis sp.]|uniref:vWA domain-containing protein n=1 Tax=Nannocystis sp. TaxID=1962667 RepID=UPI0025ED01F2|nr:VWA domain-containing protein [Nannocystis sp.]MBK7827542.1 VWA domain-containing protein [Nannocystis sp.]
MQILSDKRYALRTLALAFITACGPKQPSAEPTPPANGGDGAAAQQTPAAEEPAPQLVDSWYNDQDADGVPEFVELEQHSDPNIDQCIVEACGEEARSGRLVSKVNTLIILDVSGSMAGKAGGKGKSKLEQAKLAVHRYVETLPPVELMQVGLLAYGHKGDNTPASKAASCQAIEVLRPLGPVDVKAMDAAMKPLKPSGWSPIAGALEASAGAMPEEVGVMNHVILVADGLEGCDGDAVAIARQLRATNHLTVVDVVGFGVGTKEDTELLRNIAAATGGIYHEAATVAEFDQAFNTLNLSLWRTFDAWLCALSSDPLQACYAKRAEEAIARTEQEIEAMTKRARGEEVVASLKKIKARTEQMRDGRLRVITEYKPRIEELRVTAKRRATAEKSKPKQ